MTTYVNTGILNSEHVEPTRRRATWLDLAHRKLDHAVLAAYGWPLDITEEQILARPLALNLEQAAREV